MMPSHACRVASCLQDSKAEHTPSSLPVLLVQMLHDQAQRAVGQLQQLHLREGQGLKPSFLILEASAGNFRRDLLRMRWGQGDQPSQLGFQQT